MKEINLILTILIILYLLYDKLSPYRIDIEIGKDVNDYFIEIWGFNTKGGTAWYRIFTIWKKD